jgi:dipeptidyl aminopeptidase/acylaminoacyl peptidase
MASLIARAALFGNPVRTQARLSPDGRYISFLAPKDGVLNVWLAPFADLEAAEPITHDKTRGIREHYWALTARHLIYMQDEGGDENWRALSVDVESGAQIDLTPLAGVQAQIVGLSAHRPRVALIGLNDRQPEWHDLFEIDVTSGERKLVEKNEQGFAGYLEDLELAPRLALKTLPDGGGELFRRTCAGWESFLSYAQADSLTTRPLIVESENRALMLSALGRDKAALVRIDLASGTECVIGQSEHADIADVWLNPRTRELQAYAVDYLTTEMTAVTSAAARDIEILRAALGPQFTVTSRTLDDKTWVVVVDDPARAPSNYLYERPSGCVTKLFEQRPELANAPLVPMQALQIRARDGLTLVSYLTLPAGSSGTRPEKPLPLVLDVHGGPWARDSYGFNAEHQWLANRGYAVLAVNYRGSMGFGKRFVNAGDGEWAGKMHEDLLDAVAWAVDEKIAQADKLAIYGASYGGYAALVGLTFTPEVFACGVDLVGPSNLVTLLESIPPYWKSFFEDMARRVGDPRTASGRALLNARSPLAQVERIKRPLLIVQGANDPRVKQAESDQIVAAMQAKNLPVTYAVYADEGHGFARPENRLSFYAVAEAFLSKYLGGVYEPIGSDFEDSSVAVQAGAELVPGIAEALAAPPSCGAR